MGCSRHSTMWQGSILGALLFLCYLKGLPGIVSEGGGLVFLYADHAGLLVTRPNKEDVELLSLVNLPSIYKQILIYKN